MARNRLDVLELFFKFTAADPIEKDIGDDRPHFSNNGKEAGRAGAWKGGGLAVQRRRPPRVHEAEDVSGPLGRCAHDASSSTVISTPAIRWLSSTPVSCG